jgi:tRNA threonylcarbamoyladenosine biosynthesis protein TsaE
MRLQTATPDETAAAGAELAHALRPGDAVLVSGELGAGKTTFVRGACRALGVEEPVTSPTFAIGNVYAGRAAEVAHLDLYRLGSLAGEDPALLDDYLTPERIAFLEWPGVAVAADAVERVAATVTIEHAGRDSRTIEVLKTR